MNLEQCALKLGVAAAVVLAASLFHGARVYAQLAAGDIVVGLSLGTDTYAVYDKSSDMWSAGPGWSPTFIQGIEFDNTNGVSHNATGNLLGVNFGGGFTGFEIYNLATDGSSNSESLWSIVETTGGTKGTDPMGAWLSQRGGGLSISPDNSHIAWSNYDTGEIYVNDYSAGPTPGTGMGASITGPRRTGLGNGNGGPGTLAPLAQSVTQGTAWLNNTTVVAFNGFGELITLDISGHAGGTEDGTLAGYMPTEMTNWRVANGEAALPQSQFTDVEYNAQVDPNHIFASVTKAGSFEAELFAYDYNAATGNITLNRRMVVPNDMTNSEPQEPREIALDADGNLFYSGYAGSGSDNLVMMLPGATNVAGWDPASVQVFRRVETTSSFNGLDVALGPAPPEGLLGDYNDNGTVDAADYVVWRNAGPTDTLPNDPTAGTVDESDYTFWRAHFGEPLPGGSSNGGAVPEPASALLFTCAMALCFVATRARQAR